MRMNELPRVLETFAATGNSVELMSSSGIGKSEGVDQHVAAMTTKHGQWGYAKLMMPTANVPDMLGFMVPGHDEHGRRVSEFTIPTWAKCVNGGLVWDYERGTLFLDEWGQGESEVKRGGAELVLNRRMGPWQLPKGWHVVMAANRAKDRSGVTKSFDFVINRRTELHLEADLVSWEEWAIANGVHPLFIGFAKKNPNIVFANQHPDIQGPWCTPRSLVRCATNLVTLMGNDRFSEIPTSSSTYELITGDIGESAGAQLLATIRLANTLPPFESIIADPTGVPVPAEPDSCMLAALELAHRSDDNNLPAITTYVQRMPEEFMALFAKVVVKSRSAVTAHPAFQRMYLKNASLFTAAVAVAR